MPQQRVMKLGFKGRNWSDLNFAEVMRLRERITPYCVYPDDDVARLLFNVTSSAIALRTLKFLKVKTLSGRRVSDLIDEEQVFFQLNGGIDALAEALGRQMYDKILLDTLGNRLIVTNLVRHLLDLSRTPKTSNSVRETASLSRAIKLAIKEQSALTAQASKIDAMGSDARFQLFFIKGADTKIAEIWHQHICSAHLIYARTYVSALLLPSCVKLAGSQDARFLSVPMLPYTLSLTVAIQDFLTTLKPKGANRTILLKSDVWKLPNSLIKGLPKFNLEQHQSFSMERLVSASRTLPDSLS